MGILSILDLHISTNIQRPHGLKDKASDFESQDWGFESLCRRLFISWEGNFRLRTADKIIKIDIDSKEILR